MNFKPIGQLGAQRGIKAVLYGPPGTGKTPMAASLTNAVVAAHEPGLLSVRGLNTPAIELFTAQDVREFYKWVFGSTEIQKYDTLVVDSVSQLAEILLREHQSTTSHGMQAYGKMAEEVLEIISELFFMPSINVVLIAKHSTETITMRRGLEEVTVELAKPYLPGRKLGIDVPHLFDEIWYAHKTTIPGVGPTTAIQTQHSETAVARDRSGKLAPLEPPNLNQIFAKINS